MRWDSKDGCCKNCTKREVGCHGKCEAYIKECAEYQRCKDEIKKAKESDRIYESTKSANVRRTIKFIDSRKRR